MDFIATDMPQLTKLFLALLIVVGMMGGLAFFLKKIGLSGVISIKPGDKRRLSIVETLPLDARRRLAILKCDSREYLVILSASGETVLDDKLSSAPCEAVDTSQKPVSKA
jgi:flagellar protein FliO/FliZ